MIYSIPLIGSNLDFENNLSLSTNILSAAAITLPAFLDRTFYFTFTKVTAPGATIRTSTNYLKLVRWDGTQVGPYNVTTASLSAGSWGAAPVSPYNSVSVIKLVGIIPCDSSGVTSGNITSISIGTFQTVDSLSAFGLSALTTLIIPSSNILSSFNGKGLVSLKAFSYDSTTTSSLYEFSGIGLASLSSLSLNNQQLKSFTSIEMNNLVSLSLANNLNLPSLYCYNLNKLQTLNVGGNTNMVTLDLYGASSLTSLSANNLLYLQSSLTLNDTPKIRYINVSGSRLNNTFDSITANDLTNLDAASITVNYFNNNLFPNLTGSSQSSPINFSLKSSGTFNNNRLPALSASITVGCPDYNTYYNSFSNNNLSSLNALTLPSQTQISDELPLSAKPFYFSNNDLRNLTILQLPYNNVAYNIVENNNFSKLRDLSFELSTILKFNNNNNNIFLNLSALYFTTTLRTFNNNDLPTLSALYVPGSNLTSFSNNNLSAVKGQRISTSSTIGGVPLISPLSIDGYSLRSFENNDLRSLQYLQMANFTKFNASPLGSNRLDSLIELTNNSSIIAEFTNLTANNLVNLYYNPFNPTTFSNNSLPKLLKLWRTASNQNALPTSIVYFNNNNLPSYVSLQSNQGSAWNKLIEFTGNNISKSTEGLYFHAPYLTAFNNNNLSKTSTLNIYDSMSRRGLRSFCNNNLSSAYTVIINADLYLLSGNNFSGVTNLTLDRLQSNSLDLSSAGFDESKLSVLTFKNTKLSSLDISRTNPTQVIIESNSELSTIYFKTTANRSLNFNVNNNPKLKFDFDTLSAAAACTLTVRSQLLTSIDVSKIANLVSFTSIGNYISSFDTTGLSALTYLNLPYNHLTHLNAAGFNPGVGSLLYLSYNRFTRLNIDSIGNLNKIQHAVLDNNKFSVLNCSEFKPLTSLVILNVSYNPISALTNNTALTSLPNLGTIDLNATSLFALSLPYIPSLTTLNLSYIPTLTFLDTTTLNSLRYLSLAYTGLTSLYTPRLSSVEQLTVTGSQFTTLSTTSMSSLIIFNANEMPNLTSLKISGNIQTMSVANNPNLTDLTFENATIGDSYTGTIIVTECNLTSQSLNNFYNALGSAGSNKKGSGTIEVSQNPGYANSNTSIAEDKGWNIM